MTPFEETREHWNLKDEMVAAGDGAIKAVADSDARIAALKAAGGKPPRSPAELETLATAANLTALDRARLPQSEQDALALAEGCNPPSV